MADPSPPYPGDDPEVQLPPPNERQEATSVLDNLAAIRALLLSIARHHSVEIPREANALPTAGSLSDVDPRRSRYEEAETVNYHIRQLPNGSALESEGSPSLELDTSTLGWDQIPVGKSNVLLWVSDCDPRGLRHDRHVDYDEFGYGEDGYICSLGRQDSLGTEDLPRPGNSRYAPPPREIREHIVRGFFFPPFFLCLHKMRC